MNGSIPVSNKVTIWRSGQLGGAVRLLAGGLLLAACLTASSPSQASLTQTYYLQYVPSGLYLMQGYRGDRDDKRNVELAPLPNLHDNNFRWILQPVGTPTEPTFYKYLVHVKSGLVLTQDGPNDP